MKKLSAFSPFKFSTSFQIPVYGHHQTIFFLVFIPVFTSFISIPFYSCVSLKKANKSTFCMVERVLSALKRSLSITKRSPFVAERVHFTLKGLISIVKGYYFNSKRSPSEAERVHSRAKRSLSILKQTLSIPYFFILTTNYRQILALKMVFSNVPLYRYCHITGSNYFDLYFSNHHTRCESSLQKGILAIKNSFLIGMKLFVHAAREDGLPKTRLPQYDTIHLEMGI